ncbi:hypothetical protein EON65_46420, partial [archaeon]
MDELKGTFEALKAVIKSDEDYLLPNEARKKGLAVLLKRIFDVAAKLSSRPFGPLKYLVIEGMDEDTIWEEIQTYVKPMINYYERKTKKIMNEVSKRDQQRLTEQEAESESVEETSHDSYSSGGEDELGSEGEEAAEEGDGEDDEDDEDDEEDEEDDASDDNDVHKEQPNLPATNYDSDEDVRMEAWLDEFETLEQKHSRRQERKERKLGHGQSQGQGGDWSDEDDEDDDLSLVQKAMYDSDGESTEEEEEEEEEKVGGRGMGMVKGKGGKGKG